MRLMRIAYKWRFTLFSFQAFYILSKLYKCIVKYVSLLVPGAKLILVKCPSHVSPRVLYKSRLEQMALTSAER